MGTTPAPSPAPTARGQDVSFLDDLAKAMRTTAAAEQARDAEFTDQRRQAHLDAIRAREALEAEELRELAKEDVKGIDAWSDGEIKRIKLERERRIASRREQLQVRLEEHRLVVASEVEAVEAAISSYRIETERFFDRLGSQTDPVEIARQAGTRPPFPDLEQIGPQEAPAVAAYQAPAYEPPAYAPAYTMTVTSIPAAGRVGRGRSRVAARPSAEAETAETPETADAPAAVEEASAAADRRAASSPKPSKGRPTPRRRPSRRPSPPRRTDSRGAGRSTPNPADRGHGSRGRPGDRPRASPWAPGVEAIGEPAAAAERPNDDAIVAVGNGAGAIGRLGRAGLGRRGGARGHAAHDRQRRVMAPLAEQLGRPVRPEPLTSRQRSARGDHPRADPGISGRAAHRGRGRGRPRPPAGRRRRRRLDRRHRRAGRGGGRDRPPPGPERGQGRRDPDGLPARPRGRARSRS